MAIELFMTLFGTPSRCNGCIPLYFSDYDTNIQRESYDVISPCTEHERDPGAVLRPVCRGRRAITHRSKWVVLCLWSTVWIEVVMVGDPELFSLWTNKLHNHYLLGSILCIIFKFDNWNTCAFQRHAMNETKSFLVHPDHYSSVWSSTTDR